VAWLIRKAVAPAAHGKLGHLDVCMISGIDWLTIDLRRLLLRTADGRIERESDPDHSPGPKFLLASRSGRLAE